MLVVKKNYDCLIFRPGRFLNFCLLLLFKGNVIIVDTPGIGDRSQEVVSNLMMDYLHHALAFIFVVNVVNAGGFQDDRVLSVFIVIESHLLQ